MAPAIRTAALLLAAPLALLTLAPDAEAERRGGDGAWRATPRLATPLATPLAEPSEECLGRCERRYERCVQHAKNQREEGECAWERQECRVACESEKAPPHRDGGAPAPSATPPRGGAPAPSPAPAPAPTP